MRRQRVNHCVPLGRWVPESPSKATQKCVFRPTANPTCFSSSDISYLALQHCWLNFRLHIYNLFHARITAQWAHNAGLLESEAGFKDICVP